MIEDVLLKYNKALVIAAGGGNDAVNAVPVMTFLDELGLECGVVTALNPALAYTFEGEPEKAVNFVDGETKKFYPLKKGLEAKGAYIDSVIFQAMKNCKIPFTDYFAMSFKEGTTELVHEMNAEIFEGMYDVAILVDCGGDVFFRGNVDSQVLSPTRDALSLIVSSSLAVPCYIAWTGVGTDGEMTPEGVDDVFEFLKAKNYLLDEYEIFPKMSSFIRYKEVYDAVKHVRRGNTTRRFIQSIYHPADGDIVEPHDAYARVRELKVTKSQTAVMQKKHFGKMYWVDVKGALELNPYAFHAESMLEHFVRAKSKADVKNELDLQYLWVENNRDYVRKVAPAMFVHLLTPNTFFDNADRKKLIERGLKDLKSGEVDAAILMKYDLCHISDFKVEDAGNFVVAYHDSFNEMPVKDLVGRIGEFCRL